MHDDSDAIVPQMKQGYLSKQGRNLFKSWKKRYFVLEQGLVSYYERKIDNPPYGEKLKGQMSLRGARLDVFYEGGVRDEKRIYVFGGGTENDLLLEADSTYLAGEWSLALETHIQFANLHPELVLYRQDDSRSSQNKIIREGAEGLSRTDSYSTASSPSLSRVWDAENIVKNNNVTFDPIVFLPKPGLVVKTRNGKGSKIFINICGHSEIPLSDKKRGHKLWPLFVMGEERQSIDKAGQNCTLIDVVVNPQLISEIVAEEGEEVREATVLKILECLQKKDPGVSLDYTTPEISKRYKGDGIQEFVLVAAQLNPYGKKFVSMKAAEKNAAQDAGNEDTGASAQSSPSTQAAAARFKAMPKGKKDIGFADVVRAVIPPQSKPAPIVQLVQRHVPYIIVRPGAVLFERPEKSSKKVAKLSNNDRIYVNTKKADRVKKGLHWFRTQDGWLPGITDGGLRILEPTFEENSPVNIKISSTSFADPPPASFWESIFFFLSTRLAFQVVFVIDIEFPKGSVLKIKRSMSELCEARAAIQSSGGEPARKMKDLETRYGVSLPCEMNGDEVLLDGCDSLLEFIDRVASWLAKMGVGSTTDFVALTELLHPKEDDVALMENELMAENGFEGRWEIGE